MVLFGLVCLPLLVQILIFPEWVELLLHGCFRIRTGEGALNIYPIVEVTVWMRKWVDLHWHSPVPRTPVSCDGKSSVSVVTYPEGSHFNSLCEWPLLVPLLLATPQVGEVFVQEGGNRYGWIPLFIIPELLAQRGEHLYAGHRPRQMEIYRGTCFPAVGTPYGGQNGCE